jgi:hypothetical protein
MTGTIKSNLVDTNAAIARREVDDPKVTSDERRRPG